LFTPISRTVARTLGATGAFLIFCGLAAAPALAEPDPPAPATSETTAPESPVPSETPGAARPDLKVTAAVEPGPYVVGQPFSLKVVVKNDGEGVAKSVKGNVRTVSGSATAVYSSGWREFSATSETTGEPAPGGTLAPGESRQVALEGTVENWDAGAPRLKISVTTDDEQALADNSAEVTVPVVPPTTVGTISGIVFGDADGDGAFDDGEGLPDVELALYGSGQAGRVRTDAGGRFAYPSLPARQYNLTASSPVGGWIVGYPGEIVVDGSAKSTELRVRGERPLSEILTVKAEFDRKTYRPGDRAKITMTLTNHGRRPLTGIKARCDDLGSLYHVTGSDDPAFWGDLASSGAGVTVAAGETKALVVLGGVHPQALNQGIVYVSCAFGNDEKYREGFPSLLEYAKVPGKTSSLGGILYQDRNKNLAMDPGEIVVNARFGLSERKDGPLVAKTTSDFNGVVMFVDLPRGWYFPTVYGPWKLKEPVRILHNPGLPFEYFELEVEPGPDNPEPPGEASPSTSEPVPPPGGSSGPASGSSSGLANTGVDVFGPVAGGTAAVLAGILALLYARRLRRPRIEA